MTTAPARTPLYDWHVAHGGRMVDFAGWEMPVQYASITEEHLATRSAVGVFDISHMGRLSLSGSGTSVAEFLDLLVTRRVTDMKPAQVRYALVCNEAGGILDDVLVYRGVPHGNEGFSLVVNAGNRPKIVAWIESRLHGSGGSARGVSVVDETLQTAMIAVQGPRAIDVVNPLVKLMESAVANGLQSIRYYHYAAGRFGDYRITVSRTGYTGEDGFEIVCRAEHAPQIWQEFVQAAEAMGGMAVGLGARDTLRLEAAMPLYGHELSEAINPIQAGLGFAVNFGNREFIGREALERFARDASQRVRVGLQLDGKRVPRQGAAVLVGKEPIGEVTSGTFSPTFDRPIAMAYVEPSAQAPGTRLDVDVRGTAYPAVVVPLPFYERGK
jgi:aminomethyltransferase